MSLRTFLFVYLVLVCVNRLYVTQDSTFSVGNFLLLFINYAPDGFKRSLLVNLIKDVTPKKVVEFLILKTVKPDYWTRMIHNLVSAHQQTFENVFLP